MGARPDQQRTETHGGAFTSTTSGFNGSIKTLNLNVKARFERVENPSNEGRDYLTVKLDALSFPAPICATLVEVEGEEGLQLVRSRPNRG